MNVQPDVAIRPNPEIVKVRGSTLSQDDRPHGHLSYPARQRDNYLRLRLTESKKRLPHDKRMGAIRLLERDTPLLIGNFCPNRAA
jgi:hypothetical protein